MMLEQLKYKNHMNEVFEFGSDGIYIDSNDLHDFEWKITKKNNKISSFDYDVQKKKLPIVIMCDTEEQGTQAKNRLFEIAEKDVLALKHGQIIVGDYYLKGFVTKSQKKDYLLTKKHLKLTLTLTTDFPYWTKETVVPYGVVGSNTDSQWLDYKMDYPQDYFCDMATKQVVNSGFVPSNFRLVIYGPCVNPAVSIAGHTYRVFCTVAENEYLTIDSSSKKVFLTANNGAVSNQFNARDRASYVFEKIPPGNNVVSWNGNFAFDVILLEERSEPKWI